MDDLISRQAAIDAVDDGAELIRRVLDNMDVIGGERSKFAWGLGLLESCIDELNGLPSAQQWIPCSERLPEKTGNYLVTKVDNITNEQEMDIAYYADWLKQIVGNNGFYKHAKVVAWMPLPEPYGAERKESK